MSHFEELLGTELITKNGFGDTKDSNQTVETATALADCDQVALYFSAHWCPPCRRFTPEFAKTYNTMKAAGKKIEVVFVSGDSDRAAAKSYHDEQPWLCLPYSDRARETALSKKFKVEGIPSVIILDGKTGELVSDSGRSFVSKDPEGASFPWIPPTIQSVFSKAKLVRGDKVMSAEAALGDKKVALYFSAHWCGPCRQFTPKLVELYNKMKAQVHAGTRPDDFEFVFVSSDRDKSSFDEYFGEMPWLALDYADRAAKENLSTIFKVRGIPSLVTLENITSGRVINKNARGNADADSEGSKFPWEPEPVNDINAVTDGLNEETCIVAMLDGVDSEKKEVTMKLLENVAAKYYAEAKQKKEDPKYRFFYESIKGQISSQVRSMTQFASATGLFLVLDIPDNGGYYAGTSAHDDNLQGLIDDYENKKLTRKQLSS